MMSQTKMNKLLSDLVRLLSAVSVSLAVAVAITVDVAVASSQKEVAERTQNKFQIVSYIILHYTTRSFTISFFLRNAWSLSVLIEPKSPSGQKQESRYVEFG
jgi:ABC-type uncharacterized transport system permease subunit